MKKKKNLLRMKSVLIVIYTLLFLAGLSYCFHEPTENPYKELVRIGLCGYPLMWLWIWYDSSKPNRRTKNQMFMSH